MSTFEFIGHLDLATSSRCNRANHRWIGRAFQLISRLGNGRFWYALMIALPLVHGRAGLCLALLMMAVGAVGTFVYRLVKHGTRRLRPCEVAPALHITELPLDRFSFPSGHTLHAVAFTILVCWTFPVWSALLWPFAALVALSRLVLGLHYPSDVLMGAAIGGGLAALGIALTGDLTLAG